MKPTEIMACRHGSSWNGTPFVSVLVLNWNGAHFLGPCLRSLLRDLCPHTEIMVVDNGSEDDSIELLQNEFPQVRLVKHDQNLGFGVAYNRAVPYSRGRVLVFLNNDTVVEEGWLWPLVDPLLAEEQLGATTAKILFMGTRLLNSAGGLLKLWSGGTELGFGRDEHMFPEDLAIEPFFASGAALAIKRDLFEQLSGFDERMFAYCEDLDLCWRARLVGFKIRYAARSVVHHHFSGTAGLFNSHKARLVMRHYLRAMLKCLSWPHLLHSAPMYFLFMAGKAAALSVVQKDVRYLYAALLALIDTGRNASDIWRQRCSTQRSRVLPDRDVLRSTEFGLFPWPRELWRILRVGQRVAGATRARAPVAKQEPSIQRPDGLKSRIAER